MPERADLQSYVHRAERELRENILPFWIRHAVDRERGGFYGRISNDLVVDKEAPRGALLCSRILWTYAAAYRRYHDPEYLDMARLAYDDLMAHFWDDEHAGLYWMVDADGNPINTRKQIYGQAFGIYALSEYFRATGEGEALGKAKALFRAIEEHSYDRENKGYLEAYTRDWQLEEDLRLSDVDMNEKKSMNTHLHVMEAYANLMRVWDDAQLAERQAELIAVMMERIIDRRTYHTILFFDEHWHAKSDRISFGHDIEMSWLLVEAAEALPSPRPPLGPPRTQGGGRGKPPLGPPRNQGGGRGAGGEGDHLVEAAQALAVNMAQATLAEGVDADGGLLYEADASGILNSDKEWWPQAEAVVGFLNAYQLSSRQYFLDAALKSWDFIEQYLVDGEHGEWFRYVTREGIVGADEPKVSFWKCPYHNSRACMEMIDRIRTFSTE
jgi:mannobiose 2-epimerase